jgi:WD40 repeat protein
MPRRAIAEPVVTGVPPPLVNFAHSAPTGDAVAYVTIAPAAGGQKVTVQWLDLDAGRAGEIVDTGHGDVGAGAWRPDGRRFATTGEDGSVRVWNWHTEALVAERQVTPGAIVGLDYTGDGTRLVVGEQGGSEQGGRVFAIDAETLTPVGRAVRFDDRIVSVAASPDNRTAIALTNEPDTNEPGFALVDLVDGRVIREGELGSEVLMADYSPDGERVAISLVQSVGILDAGTGEWVRTPVDGHDLGVHSLAHAPDGNLLASGGGDGRVGLWNGRTGDLLGTMLPGRPNVAVTVEFLPDGHTLLIASADGSVYTWDTRPQPWIDHACEVAGRNLTQDEWRDAFGDRPYHRTCPQYQADA